MAREQLPQMGLGRDTLQAIANSLISSPQFQETVETIVRQAGNQLQGGPRRGESRLTTDASHPYSMSNQPNSRTRNFTTPEEEMSTLFNISNRSRSATSFRPNMARQSHSRSGINVRRPPPRVQARNTPYIIKEVVLLDNNKENKVLRPPKKAQLMEKGKFSIIIWASFTFQSVCIYQYYHFIHRFWYQCNWPNQFSLRPPF